jgi:hypothetical protein
MERGRPTTGARELEQRSLTGVTLDLFLDLFFHSRHRFFDSHAYLR